MEITELKCPCCGADIPNVDGMDGIRYCLFCGTRLSLDFGAQEVHIVDEAKIAEINLRSKMLDEQQISKREFIHSRRYWNFFTIILYIICFVSMAWGFYTINENDDYVGVVLFLLGGILLLILPAVLGFKHPIPPKNVDGLKTPKRGVIIAFLYFLSITTIFFAMLTPVAIVEG